MATGTGQQVLWRKHFDPYGQKLNGVNDKIGYTGHAFDAESGLTYAQRIKGARVEYFTYAYTHAPSHPCSSRWGAAAPRAAWP